MNWPYPGKLSVRDIAGPASRWLRQPRHFQACDLQNLSLTDREAVYIIGIWGAFKESGNDGFRLEV